MKAHLAYYRKGLIAGLGAVLSYGAVALPLVHGRASVILGGVLAIATGVTAILSPPNGPKPEGQG